MRLVSSLSCVSLAACALADGDSSATAEEPLVGVDGSTDHADRNCHVVLRELARLRDGGPGYQTSGSSWIWEGAVDISEAAAAEGLVPAVIYQYGSDATWHQVAAAPAAGAPAGFVRYTVRLDHDLPGPGMSGTALANARIEVVPLLALAGGGRLFDHNRNRGDFDNYVVTWSTDFAIGRADAVCPAVIDPEPARLVFGADWNESQVGGIVPGGLVRVEYADARLPTCRHWRNGYALYDITAHLRWEPSGAVVHASVRDGAALFDVPADARRAVLWFENTSASGCQAWDSNYGANYAFDVLAPPHWLGNAVARITRETDDTCDRGAALAGGFHFDTWARQRAAITNACFEVYAPGVTDHDDPGAVWQRLDVQVHWRGHGDNAPWRRDHVDHDRRTGNNARYAVPLRAIDPFRPYWCPDVATTSDAFYDHAAIEMYFTVNGVELRPSPGGVFVGTYSDYADNAWRAENCD